MPLQMVASPALQIALLEAGANANVADKDGNTPLHEADSLELTAALLAAGADPTAANQVKQPSSLSVGEH